MLKSYRHTPSRHLVPCRENLSSCNGPQRICMRVALWQRGNVVFIVQLGRQPHSSRVAKPTFGHQNHMVLPERKLVWDVPRLIWLFFRLCSPVAALTHPRHYSEMHIVRRGDSAESHELLFEGPWSPKLRINNVIQGRNQTAKISHPDQCMIQSQLAPCMQVVVPPRREKRADFVHAYVEIASWCIACLRTPSLQEEKHSPLWRSLSERYIGKTDGSELLSG